MPMHSKNVKEGPKGRGPGLEFHNKSVELHSEYEAKMRELNNEIKNIVEAAKTQATKNMKF